MDNLQFSSINNEQILDSRQVATMLNREHKHLLRDIEQYIEYFYQSPNLVSDDFFIKSSYLAGTGKSYKNYQITKKGCEFLAHKLTGQKGAIFTAKYINAFEQLQNSSHLTQDNQIIQMLVQSQNNMLTMIQTLNSKIDNIQSIEKIQKPIEKHPTTQKTKLTEEEKLQKLIQRGSLSARFKILKFPTKIIDMVDLLLSQEHISYTYIRKILKEKGYDISYNSIVNYHKAIQGGF